MSAMHDRIPPPRRAGVLLSLVVGVSLASAVQAQPRPAVRSRDESSVNALESLQDAFTQVAASVSSSVVAIRIESRRKLVNPFHGFPFGDWLGLPDDGDHYQVQHGTGSGLVIRSDGHILTNKHVVDNATHVEVVFRDGTHLQGKTIGIDDATDLAVVKVDARQLTAAHFADSDRAKPGQWVVAIGSPFGLDYTVTVGVVSAVGRGGMGANEIEDYLQTDASINPGNSGGPLVNLRGEVLGINTMIVGEGTGIGFAIPSNLARAVADQLIDKGVVQRSYIGVGFQELTPELAAHFGIKGRGGALVSSVVPRSPAQAAGVQPGDTIVAIDGRPVRQSHDLQRALLQRRVGSRIVLTVVRDRRERAISLVTIERPDKSARAGAQSPQPSDGDAEKLGLRLEPLTRQLAVRLGYAGLRGALVSHVVRGSIAERAGLQAGDLILEADKRPVRAPGDVMNALADGSALLRVQRGHTTSYLVLTPRD